MSASLQQRVELVQRGARRLVWRYGLARFVAAATAVILTAGGLDYSLRLHDPALRWLLSGLALAGCGWLFAKLAWPVFRFRPSLVSAARRIEQRYPALGERLTSAMAFLAQAKSDPTAGSADLRRAVVAEAEALAAGLDFEAALDRRAPRQMTLCAAAALLVACLFAALNPAAASRAVARLAQPWRALPWPRRHELAFVSAPQRLASGSDLELALIDRRGKLPDKVELLVRQGSRIETKEMKPLGERMVARLDNVTRDFAYRARGGDDDTMPWTELTVVDPPKVTELVVEVEPPAYAGLPARNEGRVAKALVGSKLRIRGQLDKPIRTAAVRSEAAGFPTPPVTIAADGGSFSAPARGTWLVERSGAFWFELTDEHGVAFGRDTRIELYAAADAPPSIAWESPADHAFVTPRAIVPVRAIVKDDLALRGIQLRYLRPGQSDEEQVVELFVGQAAGRPDQTATTGRGFEGDGRTIDHSWDLAQLAGLAPGDVLAVRLTAEDFKPQLATSVVHRLTIITDEELTSRITQRQGAILGQLAEALRMARQCREQTAALEARLLESKQLAAADLNHLQSVQHNQRQVERLLAAGPEGAEGQIVALLAELTANRVENHASGQRLSELLAHVRALNRQPLPAIDQQLADAFKSAREAAGAAPCDEGDAEAIAAKLRDAGTTQEEVVQALERMVGALSEWDSFSRLAREIGQIRAAEERLARDTDELVLQAAADAPPAAAAQNLSRQQLELARQLDKLQTRMEDMLERLQASDPLAAGTLADALNTARSIAIGGQMREAAAQLKQPQLGQARETEQLVLDGLKQLLEALSLRRDYELARTVGSLRDASAVLGGMLARSAKLQGELAAAAALPMDESRRRELQRLQRELEKLAQESQELGRRLQRLQAARPAVALGQAAASSSGAAQAAAGGDAEQAQQQGADAHRRLEEAQQELAQSIAEAERELLQEQLARAQQLVAGIAARQKNVVAEIDRLHVKEPPPAAAELHSVVAEEQLLADETSQLRPKLDAAEAFGFALEGAAEQMRRAAGLLQRGESGPAAKSAAESALTRLNQILEALQPDSAAADGAQNPNQKQAGSPSGSPSGATAELKLLHLLQQEINRRTVELEKSRASSGKLTADEEAERDALAREQGRLADMVLNLIRVAAERPEDNLDSIPELQPKKDENQP